MIAVRIALVVLLGFNGLGLMLYAAFWAVLPQQVPTDEPPARRDLAALLPFAAIGLGVVLLQSLVFGDNGVAGTAGWLVAIIAVGAGVIWHQSDPTRRGHWADNAVADALAGRGGRGERPALLPVPVHRRRRAGRGRHHRRGRRVRTRRGNLTAVFNGVIFALVGLLGVGVVVAPLLWRTFSQLRAEREGRIREQERAEVAAMIHDQVLHTLALIQRNSTDIKEVQRLARGQERSLRNWLYKPTASPTERFAAALEEAAAEVEDTYAITRGDRGGRRHATATSGSARWSPRPGRRWSTPPGTPACETVSLYAEVEADELSVFVRDRGAGFDIDTVEETRHGVRGSIIGRMQRHGGTRGDPQRPGRRHRGTPDHARVSRESVDRRKGDSTMTEPVTDGDRRLTVFLVDDHAMFRAGVRAELGAHVDVVGEASSVAEAVARISATQPDVVLLDVHMPDGGGRAVLESMRRSHPQVRFLALSVSDAAEDVIGLIRAGARGYVTKTISPDELAAAIRRVADGDAVFSPRLAGFVLDAFASRPDVPVADPELDQLTNREREVLRLLARGYAYKEIAKELYISIKTVETHVSNVLRKLQMSNRYELSRWAADRRLV